MKNHPKNRKNCIFQKADNNLLEKVNKNRSKNKRKIDRNTDEKLVKKKNRIHQTTQLMIEQNSGRIAIFFNFDSKTTINGKINYSINRFFV